VETRSAVHAIAIEKRDRRICELGGAIHEHFWQRRALKKTEGGRGMEFDIGCGHE